jgi:hypothetical protein
LPPRGHPPGVPPPRGGICAGQLLMVVPARGNKCHQKTFPKSTPKGPPPRGHSQGATPKGPPPRGHPQGATPKGPPPRGATPKGWNLCGPAPDGCSRKGKQVPSKDFSQVSVSISQVCGSISQVWVIPPMLFPKGKHVPSKGFLPKL